MTPNTKLNALIARIEGGEKLTRNTDGEIAIALGVDRALSGSPCVVELHKHFVVDPCVPHWHNSLDAIMSLARNEWEAVEMLADGVAAIYENSKNIDSVSRHDPFNPEPVLRAMLIAAAKWKARQETGAENTGRRPHLSWMARAQLVAQRRVVLEHFFERRSWR